METYDALAEFQKNDARLRIHAISTATEKNIDEIIADNASFGLLSQI